MTAPNRPAGLRRFVPGVQPSAPGPPENTPAAVFERIRAAHGESAKRSWPQTRPTALSWPQTRPAAPDETCEMCATPIPAGHNHVADLEKSSLLCACRACYLLFENSEAGGGHYRAVPERYLADPARPMTPAEWDELEIPVGLAFFLYSSRRDEVTGFYPSPAGATECRLDLTAWQRIAQAHPLLGVITPDVEAVLISRTDDTVEHFLVPIDACYELAGRMRMLWKGFDGGAQARQSIAGFIGDVRSRARVFSRESS
ncbi:MAG TPA: DUF5947 family protein [Streptosporangiaceae bacterium]|nr:DUF5947 family protein [Streptosporangiaceae bacterium]